MVDINSFVSDLANVPGIINIGAPETVGSDVRIAAIHSMSARSPEAENMIITANNIEAAIQTIYRRESRLISILSIQEVTK